MRKLVVLVSFLFFILVKCHPLVNKIQNDNVVVYKKHVKIDNVNSFSIDKNFTNILSLFFSSRKRLEIGCLTCNLFIHLIQTLLKTQISRNEIINQLIRKCTFFHIESQDVCHGAVSMFKDEIFDVLSNVTLLPQEICDVIMAQNCSGKETPFLQWDIDLPKKFIFPRILKKSFYASRPASLLKVLHLTDIHIDFDYKPYSTVNCMEPLCCRTGFPSKTSDMAGYWGSMGHCDMPMWTVEDLFHKLSREKFDYIIWSGDSLSHNIWNQTKQDQLKVLHFMGQLFDKYFTNIPVFPAVGNHEGVPVNSFPFTNNNTGGDQNPMSWLYEALSEMSSKWLSKDALKTLASGGYYTTQVSPGFRIVSLNMNFCNNLNGWLLLNPMDPSSELKWLISVLQQAEENNEKVQIIGHIAPGLPECMQAWSRNYYKIINRFHKVISAQFFGHLHYDSFQLFYDLDHFKNDKNTINDTDKHKKVFSEYNSLESDNISSDKHIDSGENKKEDGSDDLRPISVGYLSPSLTTFININPGYRVFHVDGFYDNSPWSVVDHDTYIMNLTLSNLLNETVWNKEYSAKEAYNLTSLTPTAWHDMMMMMLNNDTFFDFYLKYYYKSSRTTMKCDMKCKMFMLCAVASGKSYDEEFCQKAFFKSNNHGINFYKVFNYSEYVGWHYKQKSC